MPSRIAYRGRFATDVGGLGPLVGRTLLGTSGTATSVVLAQWPVKSLIEKSNLYEGWWLLRPKAVNLDDLVRQIPPSGYEPTTGTLLVDQSYTNPVVGANNEPIELHGHDVEPWWEMADLMEAALRLIYVPVQTPFKFPADFPQTVSNHIVNLTNGWSDGSPQGAIPALQQTGQLLRLDLLPTEGVEAQTFTLSGIPAFGDFFFTYRGLSCTALAYDASRQTIETAVRTIPGLEGVVVSGRALTGSIALTLYGAPLQVSAYLTLTSTMLTVAVLPITATAAITTPQGMAKPLKATLRQRGPEVFAELDHPILSTDRLYVTFLTRAYDWCRASATATWGSQRGVASADVAEAMPAEEWVSAAMQILYWARQPRVMVEATEQRRAQAQADAQQLFDAYQDMHLRAATRSPLLTYEVDGGPLDRPLPITIGGVTPARRGLPPAGAGSIPLASGSPPAPPHPPTAPGASR